MNEGLETNSTIDAHAEAAVAEYLRTHPDFFTRHLELLGILRVPHPCGSAISLIERQLLLLREHNAQLRKRLLDLVEVARYNDRLSERMQRLALGLIGAEGLDELLHTIKRVLRDEFSADFIALRLATQPAELEWAGEEEFLDSADLVLFESVLKSERPVCGRLSDAQARCLFGKAASQIASAAMVPLCGSDWQGLLVIGSLDQERFQPAMGTLFLNRMGALISHALQPHLFPSLDSASL